MRRRYFFKPLCLFVALTTISHAAPSAHLSKSALSKAITMHEFAVPSPAELMVALDKTDKPTWQSLYRPPIPTSYTSREQGAFNLGGLIADAYLAVEAQDAQQVKNSGRDLVALAKTLGVSENILRRDNSINDFASNSSWNTLYEELDAITNEINTALDEQSDQNLPQLIRLGAWVRATDALAAWTAKHYSAANARLLVQPMAVSELQKQIAAITQAKNAPVFAKNLEPQLTSIFQATGTANGEPLPQPQVAALHDQFAKLLAQSTK